MILVPSKNLYLPERFSSKSRQRGSVSAFPYGVLGAVDDTGPVGNVDMSTPETVIHENLGDICAAKVSFETDGTVHDYGPGAATDNGKMTAGEWWDNEPVTGVGNYYDVREDVHYQDIWTYQGASLDEWIRMSLDRKWGYRRLAMASPGVTAGYGTFEISFKDEETYIDRQNYAVQVTN